MIAHKDVICVYLLNNFASPLHSDFKLLEFMKTVVTNAKYFEVQHHFSEQNQKGRFWKQNL